MAIVTPAFSNPRCRRPETRPFRSRAHQRFRHQHPPPARSSTRTETESKPSSSRNAARGSPTLELRSRIIQQQVETSKSEQARGTQYSARTAPTYNGRDSSIPHDGRTMRVQKLRSPGCVRHESAARPSGLLEPSRTGAQERAMR